MNNKKNNIYSIIAAVAFLFIAAGSAKVNKIHCGAFNYNSSSGEVNKESESYVLLNDGTQITGKKISWKSGLIVKDQIRIDDQKFATRETRGYFSNGQYFGRYGSSYIKRIVHGRLNVYYDEQMVTTTSTSSTGAMRTSTRMQCTHYVQVGELGEIRPIANQSDIKDYVKDCSKSFEMINKKDREIRRAIRKNSNYMNDIFIIYNNGCR